MLTLPLRAQQRRTTAEEYIERYKYLAIQEMQDYGIPASITMAQGLLESGNGNSALATGANNHFGIKCKADWTGARVYHDDDEKGECFRRYRTPEESYRDHSLFLRNGQRYASLFQLDPTDYRGWARGLKSAGYATNPQYATLLINLIERYNLQSLDTQPLSVAEARQRQRRSNRTGLLVKPVHPVLYNNGVRYVVAQSGDSFIAIANERDMPVARLLEVNDMPYDMPLQEGMAVYIAPKKNKSATVFAHIMTAADSYHSVAQQYGIKLGKLEKMNPAARTQPPYVGQIIRLK